MSKLNFDIQRFAFTNGGDSVTNFADNTILSALNGNDYIENFGGGNVTIDGGAGNDSIFTNAGDTNFNFDVLIYGGVGNDTIKSQATGELTIYGGADNDYIEVSGEKNALGRYSQYATISGGTGDDTVRVLNMYTSISGGKGNDTIELAGEGHSTIKYASGDGYDTIYSSHGFDSYDVLQIAGSTFSTEKSGKDLKVNVGTGFILLKDAASNGSPTIITIVADSNDEDETLRFGNFTNGDDSYYGKTGSITLYALNGNDTITNDGDYVTIDGGAGNDSIFNTNQNVSIYGGEGDDTVFNSTTTYEVNVTETVTSTVTVDEPIYRTDTSIKATPIYELRTEVLFTGQTYTATILTGHKHEFVTVKTYVGTQPVTKEITDTIVVPVTLQTTNTNTTISGGNGNDVISLDSSTKNNVIQYASGDGNDTIYGITSNDTLKITGAEYTTVKSGSDLKLKVGTGTILVKNGANVAFKVYGTLGVESLPSGWKYGTSSSSNHTSTIVTATLSSAKNLDLSKNYPANISKVDGSKITKAVSIIGNSSANSIKGGTKNDTIKGEAGKDTLYGGAGADKLYGGNDNDYLSGDAGKDTLYGGAGADKLYGGNENDYLYGDAGNDTLYGGKGNDKLWGGNDKDKLYGEAGNDTLYGDSGSDSLSGGAGADKLYGGNENDYLYGDAGNDTLYGGNGNDKLWGGNNNDYLYGDAGNDTLYGGSGNDTLTGGKGKDIFVYESGKDVITDYTAGQDKIKISGKVTKKSYSGKDVVFTIGSGTLTVKNGKGKKITVTDSSNVTKTYSKTADLFDDNNFISNDTNLDSITESKVAVQNIETQNYNNLAQDYSKLITYADK